jgi:hypothetical protein
MAATMEFIRLTEVITAITESIDLDPAFEAQSTFGDQQLQTVFTAFWERTGPVIEHARKRGAAAWLMNRALHQSKWTLRWFEHDEAKRFAVEREAIGPEAIDLLTQESNFGNALLDKCAEHVRQAAAGYRTDLLDADFIHDPAARPWMLRMTQIGSDRSEIVAFLNASDIPHTLGEPAIGTPTAETSEQRRERIRRERDELVAAGHRSPTKTVADREGISTQRIRKLLNHRS